MADVNNALTHVLVGRDIEHEVFAQSPTQQWAAFVVDPVVKEGRGPSRAAALANLYAQYPELRDLPVAG